MRARATLALIALAACASGTAPASIEPHLTWPIEPASGTDGRPRLGVGALTDDRAEAGTAIQQRVREAFERDELAVALEPALRAAESDAVRLLTIVPKPAEPPVSPPPPPPGTRLVERSRASDLDPARAREVLAKLEQRLTEKPNRRLTIDWRIDESEGRR